MKRSYDKVTLLMHSALVAINYLLGLLLYFKLPDSVPITYILWSHTVIHGPKALLCFGIPTGILLLFLLLEFAPMLDPRCTDHRAFSRRYKTLQSIILLFISIFYWWHIHVAQGVALAAATAVPVLAGAFLTIIGNYIVTIRHNYIFGIRTPWALSSEWNWRKTHRFAGRLWVAVGIAVILCGLLCPPTAIVFIFLAIVAPIIYSLVLYLKYESNNTGGSGGVHRP